MDPILLALIILGALVFIYIIIKICLYCTAPELEERWERDGQEGVYLNPCKTRVRVEDTFFPPNFVWGTATAAHQIEGGNTNNNWYRWENSEHPFAPRPTVLNHDKSGNACDHWNRIDEDINLMKEIGVNAYRMSIEWSRIEPSQGAYDEDAIRHYHEEIDKVLAAGIVPFVTLLHFTVPIWFDDMGGFEREENIPFFVQFASKVFAEYSPKVKNWCTVNEPGVHAVQTYVSGFFPPGHFGDLKMTARFLKHLLMAHVEAYYACKAINSSPDIQIGIVKNIFHIFPNDRYSILDRITAHIMDSFYNELILNFFKTGRYKYRMFCCVVNEDYTDLRAIKSNDFIGLNYYSYYRVKAVLCPKPNVMMTHLAPEINTDMGYPMYAEGLYTALKRLQPFNVPLYITECGLADYKDDRRALFIQRYLFAASKALREGVNLKGFFYWSLLDNFEWALGYTQKFGLYEVNTETQERRLRNGSLPFVQAVKHFSKLEGKEQSEGVETKQVQLTDVDTDTQKLI